MAENLDPDEELQRLISENGGDGEWESNRNEDGTLKRWLYPRFAGAEYLGTCDVHDGVHEFESGENRRGPDPCVDFVQDQGNMYLSRSGIGYDTDVETVAAWLLAPRNMVGCLLILGHPGTGKTALIEAAVTSLERSVTTVLCTPDHTMDSLFLRFVGEGKGDLLPSGEASPYTLGPIPYAAKHGHVLYMDEALLLQDGVKPVLYALADGRGYLPEGNVDGSPLRIHPDFRLVLSSNPLVRGASLPEPLASRAASTTLTIETDADMLADLGIDGSVIAAWDALGAAGHWQPAIRELRLADYWMALNPAQAVSAFLPEHCPESQRSDIRELVTGFLGGKIREDGRLVVS